MPDVFAIAGWGAAAKEERAEKWKDARVAVAVDDGNRRRGEGLRLRAPLPSIDRENIHGRMFLSILS